MWWKLNSTTKLINTDWYLNSKNLSEKIKDDFRTPNINTCITKKKLKLLENYLKNIIWNVIKEIIVIHKKEVNRRELTTQKLRHTR